MRPPVRSHALALPLLLLLPTVGHGAPSPSDPREYLSQVRLVPTPRLGVPSPEGLAGSKEGDVFFVLEPSLDPEGTRIHRLTVRGERLDPDAFLAGALDPANVAHDARSGRLVLLDASVNELIELPVGPDQAPDPSAAVRTRIEGLGLTRAAGIALDPNDGSLYVLDRLSQRIARVPRAALEGGAAAVSWIAPPELGGRELRGIAFNPTDGLLYVVSASPSLLFTVAESGEVRGQHALEGFGVLQPRGLAFASSGDRTDDPAALSLYVADAGPAGEMPRGRLVEIGFRSRTIRHIFPEALRPSTLVRTTDMSRFSPPSPDPSGLAYDSARDRLLIDDGEVEETGRWANANVFEVSRTGSLLRTWNAVSYSDEPVGMAFDPTNRFVYISDDDSREVTVINPGADLIPGTSDDSRTFFDTRDFDSDDPEGITLDPVGRRLYIADGVNREVYQIAPGANGKFDGVDDVVTHFDTGQHDIDDPETVEYNLATGTLFIIGSGGDRIVETTPTGTLISEIDVSDVPLQHAAGMTFAPGTTDPAVLNLFIVHRGVDNDSNSSENDGKLFEIAFAGSGASGGVPGGGGGGGGSTGGDVPVAAGSDDAEQKGTSVSLTSSDLELVDDGGVQTVGIRFANLDIPQGATVSNAYIQFHSDEAGSAATSLLVHGQDADHAATFTSASNNITSRPLTSAAASWSPAAWTSGQAGPDQRTPDLSAIVNEIVGRSDWSSGNALAFIITGTGKRTADSYEGGVSNAPILHFELGGTTPPPSPTNQAPVVNAGPDRSIVLPSSAALDGTVTDDGLPSPPSLTTAWSKFSGPGTVTFVDPSSIDTQASFSASGRYVLQLLASDGGLSASDTMAVTVAIAVASSGSIDRRVSTSSDDAEQKGSSVDLSSSDLELVVDGSAQTVGMRFPGIEIPQGAVITSAYVQFKTDEAGGAAVSLTIRGQYADNAATFTTAANNISSRPTTAASVAWSPPGWTSAGQAGPNQRTPDLAAIVQEIVDRPGWVSGNALVILVTGTGKRTAEAFNGDAAGAPLLHVEYQ
jgi:sugar lactone lactonase YvrE